MIPCSFLVPLVKVVAIQNCKVQLSWSKELPISDSCTGFIRERLNQKLYRQGRVLADRFN
jgi:hypothetical protein